MAKIEMKEIKELDKKDLLEKIRDMKREAMNLRFQQVSGELENTARFREVRRSVARLYTQLNSLDASA